MNNETYGLIKSLESHTVSSYHKNLARFTPEVSKPCDLFESDRYRYHDKWYYFTYSDDNFDATYGIIGARRLPYKKLTSKTSHNSFMERLDKMIFSNEMQPFMLFINDTFIPWHEIYVIKDYELNYLKILNKNYNHYTIKKINMITLPFYAFSISVENDYLFNLNYNAVCKFINKSVRLVNGNITVDIPKIDTQFIANKGEEYSIGIWYYSQLALHEKGKLSETRIQKLKNVVANYEEKIGDKVVITKSTTLNLLDLDSYDSAKFMSMLNANNNELLSFTSTGLYTTVDANKAYSLYYGDSDMGIHISNTTAQTEYFYEDNYKLADTMCKFGFVGGKLRLKSENDFTFEVGHNNIYKFTTTEAINADNPFTKVIIYRKDLESIKNFKSEFYNNYMITDYIKANLTNAFSNSNMSYIEKLKELDFEFKDSLPFEQNYENAENAIIQYDPRLMNSLYTQRVYSRCITGKEFNDALNISFGNDTNYGLKVPIPNDNKNETYVMVFINGELIADFDKMTIYPDHILFKTSIICEDADIVEIVYYLDCNNNELSFIYDLNNAGNYKLFEKIIPNEDAKFFIKNLYGRLALSYPALEYKEDEVAFPCYKESNGLMDINRYVLKYNSSLIVKNSDGKRAFHYYDPLGREIMTVDFDGNESINCYDDNGNILWAASNSEIDSLIGFDSDGPILPWNISNEEITEVFTYDSNNNMISYINKNTGFSIENTYVDNLLTNQKFIYPLSDGGEYNTAVFDYENSNIKSIITTAFPSTLYGIPVSTISYEYDASNRVTKVTSDSNAVIIYSYVDSTNLINQCTTTLPETIGKSSVATYSYDINQNLISIATLYSDGTTNLEEFEYDSNNNQIISDGVTREYDSKGRVTFYEYTKPDGSKYSESYKYIDGNEITVASRHKFVYQRINVTQKSYKVKIDGKRFRFCDNMKQYCIYINGRRMYNDRFLITLPKVTRPFNEMWLYSSIFLKPGDRIDLFYLPIESTDISTDYLNPEISTNGYMTLNKTRLEIPFDPSLFMVYINGRKIPTRDMMSVKTNLIRFKQAIKYISGNIVIIPLYENYISKVKTQLESGSSDWDNMIDFITNNEGVSFLDNLIGSHIHLSDIEEPDALHVATVEMIAIANEIVRDFWIANGYDYQAKWFEYDYYTDEYFTTTDNDTYLYIPAMDATRDINIIKYDVHHLFFGFDPLKPKYYEIGTVITRPTFIWEYNDVYKIRTIEWQKFNNVDIGPDIRNYTVNDIISTNKSYTLEAYDGFNTCASTLNVKFSNGVYYGLIDEDLIDGNASDIYSNDNRSLILALHRDLQEIKTVTLKDYIVGNNKYFIVAMPRRYAYQDNELNISFYLPELNTDEVIAANNDEFTTPILTNGKLNPDATMVSLDSYKMEILNDRFSFTNQSGFTEDYIIFKSNGFFTRLYENVKFNFYIR